METKANGSTQKTSRIHVHITPDNSIDKTAIPSGVPCTYMSPDGIQGTEREGYIVLFVVNKVIFPSHSGQKDHFNLKPIRNTIGDYLVIVCRK